MRPSELRLYEIEERAYRRFLRRKPRWILRKTLSYLMQMIPQLFMIWAIGTPVLVFWGIVVLYMLDPGETVTLIHRVVIALQSPETAEPVLESFKRLMSLWMITSGALNGFVRNYKNPVEDEVQRHMREWRAEYADGRGKA